MTTIWENDDGTYESGCGCVYEFRDRRRFVVVKRSPTCHIHKDALYGTNIDESRAPK